MSEVATGAASATGTAGANAASGAAANTGTTGGTGTSGGAANAASGDWTSSLTDEHKGYVQNKGWKDTGAVVDSYRNFEKLMGNRERLVKLPEKDDDPEWNNVYSKLGRPEKPEEYQLEIPKEHGDPEFAKWSASQFHKLGMSRKQGETLVKEFNARQLGAIKTAQEASQAQLVKETDELSREWGPAKDQNLQIAKKGAQVLGVDAETLAKIEHIVGYKGLMKMTHALGLKVGEDSFENGNGGGNNNLVPTPQAAAQKIAQLKADGDWTKKYLAGGKQQRDELNRLLAIANPT